MEHISWNIYLVFVGSLYTDNGSSVRQGMSLIIIQYVWTIGVVPKKRGPSRLKQCGGLRLSGCKFCARNKGPTVEKRKKKLARAGTGTSGIGWECCEWLGLLPVARDGQLIIFFFE
jgi:hypothetical protein